MRLATMGLMYGYLVIEGRKMLVAYRRIFDGNVMLKLRRIGPDGPHLLNMERELLREANRDELTDLLQSRPAVVAG